MAEPMSKADLETETRVSVLETQVDTIAGSVIKLEQKIVIFVAIMEKVMVSFQC